MAAPEYYKLDDNNTLIINEGHKNGIYNQVDNEITKEYLEFILDNYGRKKFLRMLGIVDNNIQTILSTSPAPKRPRTIRLN